MTKRRKRTIIRTAFPQATWRLLNAPPIKSLTDQLNHLLLMMPMIQSQRETIIAARDLAIKHSKKRGKHK